MSDWRNVLSNGALVVLTVVGLAYLVVEVARIDPTEDPVQVTLKLPTSGGLLDTSAVTYRGVEVGKVSDIRLRRNGVEVDLQIDEDTQIPRDSEVRIAGLNPAGEQYVDFRPRSDRGPYLVTGAVIDNARTPTPFARLLNKITKLADQIDPDKLRLVLDELSTATNGAAGDLKAVVEGSDYLLTGLEDVLPETVRTLRNGGTLLRTVVDLRDELQRLGISGKAVATQLQAADPDLRALLDRSPKALRLVNTLLDDLGPEADALLHNLGSYADTVAPRTAALGRFFPSLTEAGEAVEEVGGRGRLTVLVDLWPRAMCDYGNPAKPPSVGGWPEPRLNRHCEQARPDMQQRGSYYAPRPANDPTRHGNGPGQQRASTSAEQALSASGGSWYANYLAMLTYDIEGS